MNARLFALVVGLSIALSGVALAGEEIDVMVIDRQENVGTYTYVVPGRTTSTYTGTSRANVNCTAGSFNADCTGSSRTSGRTTGVSTPSYVGSYNVRGATLSLQLPDGRIAVVNCESKIAWKQGPDVRRDCRVPLVANIKAEFKRDNAKLRWPVSIDGRKMQDETYTIVAVLEPDTSAR